MERVLLQLCSWDDLLVVRACLEPNFTPSHPRRGIMASGPGVSAAPSGSTTTHTTIEEKKTKPKKVKKPHQEAMDLIAQGSTKTVECDGLHTTLTENLVCPGLIRGKCA